MLWSKCLIPTLKENPKEAEIKSHRLMLRAGLIRRLASGTYSYLPLGLRALKKAEAIVREEMNSVGAQELLLPALHPAEIWKESGRWEILGDDMIHFKDRHGKENVLGPTHEEIITDLARREIHSYKQLPLTLYQIQTKFRDELRPRSGVIRSREFVMKDAYSFHADAESLDKTYEEMKKAYQRIFTRCGLNFFIVQADPGAMGGSGSQEFVLFSDAGEDRMVQWGESDTVVSVEMAFRRIKGLSFPQNISEPKYTEVSTPGHSSVEGVATLLGKKPQDLVKTMVYQVEDSASKKRFFAVLVRGDHEVSDYKIRRAEPGANLAHFSVFAEGGSAFGFSGPVQTKNCFLRDVPFYVDEDVLGMKDFIVGANEKNSHLTSVNLSDILSENPGRKISVGDYRQVTDGDQSPSGEILHFKTAIELGHIFKLNLRYSLPLKANFLDDKGKSSPMMMGCYGIGVNRILAAAIEQQSDEKGIVWPKAISPYQVSVVIIDPQDTESNRIAQSILGSETLAKRGIDVLVDDRAESAGVKLKDADLIGAPLQVILGPKNLKLGKVEIKIRKTQKIHLIDEPATIPTLIEQLDNLT